MSKFSKIEILSLTKVCELITLSRSTIYRLIKAGDFPAPINLSANRSGFRLSDIEAWITTRSAINSIKLEKSND